MNLPLPANDLCHPEPPLTAKQKQSSSTGGLWFVPEVSNAADAANEQQTESREPKPKQKPPKRKYHPKYVEAARELCARFLDEVNEQGLLAEGSTQGKYDVSRALGTDDDIRLRPDGVRLLDAA